MAHGHAFLFVPVLTGAGAAWWFSLLEDPPLWPVVAVFVALALAFVVTRGRGRPAHGVLAASALLVSGMLLAQWETSRRNTIILDAPVTTHVTGVVERREVDASGRWRYIVRILATMGPALGRPPQRALVLARARHSDIAIGAAITGRARLSPPSGPALDGLHDFAFTSYFDGVGAVGFFYGAPKAAELSTLNDLAWNESIKRALFSFRSSIAERIRAAIPGDAGAFAAAIVTDERRAISAETVEALRLSGLAHIVAISGLNMALAAGIFFIGVRTLLSAFTSFAQSHAIKKIAAVGAVGMATAYYLISGFGVSAQRAYIMMAVMLIAVLLDRPAISMRNVAISALVIITIAPSEILGPSFQMSFAATAALVAGYVLWKRRREADDVERFPIHHPLVTPLLACFTFLCGIFMTSLIGGLSTSIYSVEHFHRLATYGLAANLAAMPIISFIVMPAGLLAMLLMPFGLAAPFLTLMGYGLEAVIAVAKHVAAWGGDVAIGRQHPWFLPVATFGFLLLVLLRTRLRLLGIPPLLLAVSLSWHQGRRADPDLLVSEDGTLVALTSTEGVAINRGRPPDFTYGQWTRALALPALVKPDVKVFNAPAGDLTRHAEGSVLEPSIESEAFAAEPPSTKGQTDMRRALSDQELDAARSAIQTVPEEVFVCFQKAFCATKTREAIIVAVVEDPRFAGAACDVADVVIASRARFDTCRSGALMISGNALRKTGALEITFNGARTRSSWTAAAAMSGRERPWNIHRHYEWRSKTFNASLPAPLQAMLNGTGE